MLVSNSIKNAFNRAGLSYDQHCHLQTHTGYQLLLLAKQLASHPKRIIDLGCGTGLITKTLAALFPEQTLHAIDIADRLLAAAQKYIENTNVLFTECSFDNLPKQLKNYDLMFSNLALHWSQQLPKTLQQLNTLLNADGSLLFSIPLQGTLSELNGLFSVNSFYEANFIIEQLSKAGFSGIHHYCENISYHFNSTIEALRSIKFVGATHTPRPKQSSLKGKTFLKNASISTLSYHIGYFYAHNGMESNHAK